MDFDIHTIDTAPGEAKPLLEDSKKAYGRVPNLHGVMAETPPLLEAYKAIGALYAKTDLSVLERQIVLLAINAENECHYCMAAHSVIAQLEKMPAEILSALREGRPIEDAKLQALRAFAEIMVRERGWVKDDDIQTLLDAGYTKQTVQEVILAVSYKVMSNYMNHVAATPVDEGFQGQAWTKPAA